MFNHKNRKSITLHLVLAAGVIFSSVFIFAPTKVGAQVGRTFNCADGTVVEIPASAPGGITAEQACVNSGGPSSQANDQGYETSNIEADCTASAEAKDCGITRYLVLFINVLSVLAGIVIAASIAYGGIQYSTSGSDPQRVSAAKDRIRNAIIALVFFIFGYSILNYLIPGGLL